MCGTLKACRSLVVVCSLVSGLHHLSVPELTFGLALVFVDISFLRFLSFFPSLPRRASSKWK